MIDDVVKINILLSALWETIFFVLFIRTKWYKKELGPYVFRKELCILIILLLVVIITFIHQLPRDIVRPFSWILIQLIMLDQLRKFMSDDREKTEEEE